MSVPLAHYEHSAYWLGVQVSFHVLGMLFTLSVLLLSGGHLLQQAREASLLDPLTQLHNRRGFEERWRRWERESPAFSLVLLDIDHFKHLNDAWGHQYGDEVLRQMATILQQHLRPGDVVARFGGEKFVVYLPHITHEQTAQVAERLRQSIATYPFTHGQCTCSFGVGSFLQGADFMSAYSQVDALLYEAKREGRNCVKAAAYVLEPRSDAVHVTAV